MPILSFLLGPIGRFLIVGAIGAAVGFGGAWRIQGGRLDTSRAQTTAIQAQYDTFAAGVKLVGEKQEADTKALIATHQKEKESADAQNAKTKSDLAGIYASYRKLRDQRAGAGSGSSQVSSPATFTPSAARSCFDSAKFVAAMGILEVGVPRITEQGDSAIVDLNSSKNWGQAAAAGNQ